METVFTCVYGAQEIRVLVAACGLTPCAHTKKHDGLVASTTISTSGSVEMLAACARGICMVLATARIASRDNPMNVLARSSFRKSRLLGWFLEVALHIARGAS